MRSEAIAILLSLGVAAAPAWAGPAQDTGPAQSKAQDLGNQGFGNAPAFTHDQNQSDQSAQNGMPGLQSQDALKQSLQKAGFSDLQIAAGSYIVHAKGPGGKPVVMVITPDSIAVAKPQTAELPDNLGQNGDQSGTGSPNDQSGGGAQDQDNSQQLQND